MTKEELLIGAHTSISKGVFNAPYRGRDIGATTIQIFTSNQKQWSSKPISKEDVDKWNKALEETQIKDIMSHDSYLINLGSCNDEILNKSRKAFEEEIKRCHLLNIPFLNFHPGAATSESEGRCLDTIIESLLLYKDLVNNGPTRLILETTAGQGTNVGYCFDHLGYIIDRVKSYLPIGICIDTCHIFAAGYDIRTEEAINKMLKEFDEKIGLSYLYAFHLNDSLHDIGSRKDRHANLGEGKIGWECFKILMTHPKTRKKPKYLETPKGEIFWEDEITTLKQFALNYNP